MTHTPEPWKVHGGMLGHKGDIFVPTAKSIRDCHHVARCFAPKPSKQPVCELQIIQMEREAISTIEANARRIVACVNALSGISTEAIEAGGVQELAEALREIRDMKPREYTGPEFDREVSDACPDCIKYQGHPIQQGICDEHRRPFYAREDHDKFEERAKGSRCYLIASAALSKWEASK